MQLYSTKEANKAKTQHLDLSQPVWVFGYGSLIYKVDFPFLDKALGYINGWQRRYWMASQDHRGTPAKPGRVLTIDKSVGTDCFGVAYLIKPEVLIDLDHREQNGYLREVVDMTTQDNKKQQAITYIGDPNAPVYDAETDNQVIAQIIFNSVGPSGPNIDYALHMADALRNHKQHDDHIFDIEQRLKQLKFSNEI